MFHSGLTASPGPSSALRGVNFLEANLLREGLRLGPEEGPSHSGKGFLPPGTWISWRGSLGDPREIPEQEGIPHRGGQSPLGFQEPANPCLFLKSATGK